MFKYPICIPEELDIDELIDKWNNDSKIVNYFHRQFTPGEYALINFILNEGLKDVRGQEPDITPPDDDPYNRPNIDNPNLDPDNPSDDDPYARPAGWNPADGIFYDQETGNLVDKDGNIIKPGLSKTDHPLWNEWKHYWFHKYLELDEDKIPPVAANSENTEWEDWVAWLADNGIEIKPIEPEEEEKPKPDDEDYILTTPDADLNNPNWKKWVEYCRLFHPDWYSVPHTPIDENDPDYEGFMNYLKQQEKPEGPPEYEYDESNTEHPYWSDWFEYYINKYPNETYIPPVPEDSDSPEWDDFVEYMTNKSGNEGIATLGEIHEF